MARLATAYCGESTAARSAMSDRHELWARVHASGRQPTASRFVELCTAREMRSMLGIAKNLSKSEMSKRLERAASSGSLPPRLPRVRRMPRARRESRGADDDSDDGVTGEPCTQTLAKGWYTPKHVAQTDTSAKKATTTGDVVWCKMAKAPWWPALIAVSRAACCLCPVRCMLSGCCKRNLTWYRIVRHYNIMRSR
eukprot:COSAG06_NODE_1078_length_10799_cov_118.610748_2_plen_196_part_00